MKAATLKPRMLAQTKMKKSKTMKNELKIASKTYLECVASVMSKFGAFCAG